MQGLDELSLLNVLSLADNQITDIEGLDGLKNLQVLNLGDNKIKVIGDSIFRCPKLKELNLSGNQITSFREVLKLTSLKSLKKLSLKDPNFADNPICALGNYKTFIVHHFTNIECFDQWEITDQFRKPISETMTSKFTFYNMRVNIVRRNCQYLVDFSEKSSSNEMHLLESQIRSSLETVKKLEGYITLLKHKIGQKVETRYQGELNRLERIKESINTLVRADTARYTDVSAQQKAIKIIIERQGNNEIRSILLELETGGNVCIESKVGWGSHCENMINNFIDNSKTNIKIHRISKVCNRATLLDYKEYQSSRKDDEFLLYHDNQKEFDSFYIAENGYSGKIDLFDSFDYKATNEMWPRKAIITRIKPTKSTDISNCPESLMIPEYLIEYTLEDDLRSFSPSNRMILDIAFSNQISDSALPNIALDLTELPEIAITAEKFTQDDEDQLVNEYHVFFVLLRFCLICSSL
jgi:Leucine-rich repeat